MMPKMGEFLGTTSTILNFCEFFSKDIVKVVPDDKHWKVASSDYFQFLRNVLLSPEWVNGAYLGRK